MRMGKGLSEEIVVCAGQSCALASLRSIDASIQACIHRHRQHRPTHRPPYNAAKLTLCSALPAA
jgi:hypothetical protein